MGKSKWVFALASVAALGAQAQDNKAEKLNMELVGYSDLQGRSAYQPTIHKQGDRWIAYVGHHGDNILNPLTGKKEDNGTSIVDVTDVRHPKYLAHIPGQPGLAEAGGAQMVRVCDGTQLPKADKSKVYLLRTFGNQAHQLWNVTDPAKPEFLNTVSGNLKDTHKNWWECDTGIAYLVSGVEGWRVRRMTQVYDLSDPERPVFIRNFGLPGQQPGATGTAPADLHGPISTGPKGNRVYFGYGTDKGGVLQIVDREKLLSGPKEPSSENLLYPQVGRLDLQPTNGAHTVLPLLDMPLPEFVKDKQGARGDFVMIVNEQILNECLETRQRVWFVDVTAEAKPFGVSNFNVPEKSGNFCSRGGRFGSHSPNENQPPMYAKRLVFVAWFNAGVRAIDIRDPYNPREVGFYVPARTAKTDKRCIKLPDGKERCKIAIQTNNLEVDDRGYIYIVDRANSGMHILRLTGEARKIANF
ncbi:MAG TPA: hypothetical protein VEF92_10030 [Burkholderiales bacterium]|nr:hypothetical protein [Burkholderiales bacterium]HYA47876.1 hypothetical protein [Burkholderiales bacterium]